MSSISFWTPVKYGNQPTTLLQKTTEFVDDYFYLGGRVAHVMSEGKVVLGSGHPKWWQTGLKVISYVAVFPVPVGMLVMKVVLRRISRFEVQQKFQLFQEGTIVPALIPPDLNLEILKFLDPKDLANASLVCREWKELASTPSLWRAFDLKKLFPKLSVIDQDVWNKYIDLESYEMSCKGEELIDRRNVIQELYRMFKSLQIENDAGITLLTMPKGLTLKKLEKFAASPKSGNILTCNFYRNFYIPNKSNPLKGNSHCDWLVPNTYQVVITNSILKGSRALIDDNDRNYHAQKFNCDLPRVSEVSTLAILADISSSLPTHPYSDNPPTLTQCSDMWMYRSPVCSTSGYYEVGNFGSNGIHINEKPSIKQACGVGVTHTFRAIDYKSLSV